MAGLTLYQLSDGIEMLRVLQSNPDTLTEDWEQALSDLTEEAGEKVAGIGLLVREYEAEEATIKAEEDRLRERRQRVQAHREWLEGYLLREMPLCGLERVREARITVSLVSNPPAVTVDDEDALPRVYKRYLVETTYWQLPSELRELARARVLKEDIMRALKAGLMVPGARLTRGTRIKTS